MKAAKSHMEFIQHIQPIDVYLSSYTTKYDSDLLEVYHPNLIGYHFHDQLIGQKNLIHHGIQHIKLSYDFIFIVRIDIFLKPKMSECFKTWNTIRWPSICYKPYHLTKKGYPRVNDIMMYVPKKYFSYLPHVKYGYGHDQWEYFMTHTNLTSDDLDTMLPTYHDSDSSKDSNPLYYIVNREECKIQHCTDKFNKSQFHSTSRFKILVSC